MTLTNLTGIVKFKVAGQKAQPKYLQELLKNALAAQVEPPESLRYQCRIASDARENFKKIELEDGETLTLHPSAKPQFGKNHKGHAYLTVTMIYSGDGRGYRLRWTGEKVPQKMQEVAVKHDKGLAVKPIVVGLDLSSAEVTPSWKAAYHSRPPKPGDWAKNQAAAKARIAAGQPKAVRSKRSCARLEDSDLNAVAA